MKKILKMFFCLAWLLILVVSFNVISVKAINSTPSTPKGTVIKYYTNNSELNPEKIQAYLIDEDRYVKNGAIRIDNPTAMYNGHSYAWFNQDYLSNHYSISSDEIEKYIDDGSYIETQSVNVGDIICFYRIKIYYNNNDRTEISSDSIYLSNSAIVTSVENGFNIDNLNTLKYVKLISKWGDGGLYEHTGDNHPYAKDWNHKLNGYVDTLHFTDLDSSLVDDGLFYIKAYTPNINDEKSIGLTLNPIFFENELSLNDCLLYKLNIFASSKIIIKASSNQSVDVKLYDQHMMLECDNYSINNNNTTMITDITDGVHFISIKFLNSNYAGSVHTNIVRQYDEEASRNGLLADINAVGSEVHLNNGLSNGDTITEGFTRCLSLNPTIESPKSRLEYDWYSSNPNVATVSQYGTVLAISGGENLSVTIVASNKTNRN